MIREIKALGLAFIIVAVASVSVVSAAQAAEFHAESGGNVSLFGKQVQQLKLTLTKTNQSVVCTQVLFEGTIPGTGGSQTTKQVITLTPTITGCTFAGLTATADMSGCKLAVKGSGTPALTTLVDIVGCTQTDANPSENQVAAASQNRLKSQSLAVVC